MKGQTLSNDEILLVRWAYDDPNPKREREEEEAGRNEALQRINQKGISLAPAEYHYPQQYQLPGNDPKMPRIGNESVATDYPDTSQQYGSGPLTMEDMERITKDAEARQREERLYSILDSIPSFGGAAASSSEVCARWAVCNFACSSYDGLFVILFVHRARVVCNKKTSEWRFLCCEANTHLAHFCHAGSP